MKTVILHVLLRRRRAASGDAGTEAELGMACYCTAWRSCDRLWPQTTRSVLYNVWGVTGSDGESGVAR